MNLPETERENLFPSGSYPAMLTAFHDDGSIDWHGVDRLVEDCLENGAAGIFACGLSAEILQMDDDEKSQLAEYIIARVNGRVPVVAAAITSGTIESQAALIHQVHAAGAEAVAIGVCQLAAANEDDSTWISRGEALLEQIPADVRLSMYECPLPYHRLLTEQTISWAASSGQFYFLKDTSCCIETIQARLRTIAGSNLELLNANTATLLDSLNSGARGFCGIGANYMPRLYAWLCQQYSKKTSLAAELQKFLTGTVELTEGNTYPASAKHYLRMRGLDIGTFSRKIPGGISATCAEQLALMRSTEVEWLERISAGSSIS